MTTSEIRDAMDLEIERQILELMYVGVDFADIVIEYRPIVPCKLGIVEHRRVRVK